LDPIDKLTIDTPEQITLELPLAGIGSRFIAFALDSLLQAAAGFLIFLIVIMLASAVGGVNMGGVSSFVPLLLILMVFFLRWCYFVFFEIRWNGQTPGKRMVKIRVIKESGRPVTALEVLARNLLRPIDAVPGSYAVGLVCMMLNKQNKRLGDYVAGTVLIYDKAGGTINAIRGAGERSADMATQSFAARISPEELKLVETYLNRRSVLDVAVRRRMAEQIVATIRKRIGIGPEAGQSADAFLEALALNTRDTADYRR